MNDGVSLLRAIRDNPGEDTPRLMYADYLDEQGQPERAEWIRLQCQPPEGDAWHTSSASCTCRRCLIGRKEAKLLPHFATWLALKPFPAYSLRSGEYITGTVWHPNEDAGRAISAEFTRGFVSHVMFRTAADFLEFGPAIFAHHPIERVTLMRVAPRWGGTDYQRTEYSFGREPKHAGNVSRYLNDMIPDKLRRFWPHKWTGKPLRVAYKSGDDAVTALNAACLAYGRKHAKAFAT